MITEMASMASYEKFQNVMALHLKNFTDSHKLQSVLSISSYLLQWYNMREEIVTIIVSG